MRAAPGFRPTSCTARFGVQRFGPIIVAFSFLPGGAVGCDSGGEEPGGPCLHTQFVIEGVPSAARRLDLVVVLDDSGSMTAARRVFAEGFWEMLRRLLVSAGENDRGCVFPPIVDDLHLAVLSPGLGGTAIRGGICPDPDGDDGCFRRTGATSTPGCLAESSPFLSIDWRDVGDERLDRFAADLRCLLDGCIGGCGFRQPLAAAVRAISEQAEPGGCNAGFRRPDARLALLIVTDRDDCSVDSGHPEIFDPSRTDLGPMSVRCALHPELLIPVRELYSALRRLEDPREVMLGMIVGVPPDAPHCVGQGDSLSGCLDSFEMQVRLDPGHPDAVIPACRSEFTAAAPARRFVELAQLLGWTPWVASVCDPESWERMFPEMFFDLLPNGLRTMCAARALPFEPDVCRTVCVAVETLTDDRPCASTPECPSTACPTATTPAEAEARPCIDPATDASCTPLKRDLGTIREPDGSLHRRCLLRQAQRLPLAGGCGPPVEEGWYYVPGDDRWCPQIFWGSGPSLACPDFHRGILAPGSWVELHCLLTVCADAG